MKTRFVLKLGRALHECGTTSQRMEMHLENVARMLGLNGSFLISPTTFTCALWETDVLDQFVHIERIEPAEYNLGRLWEIDRLVESIGEGRITFSECMEALEQVVSAPPTYPKWVNAISWALIGGSFSALLSPNTQDCIAAAVLSLILFFLTDMTSRNARWNPVITMLGPFVSGVLACGISVLGIGINVPFVVLSSIIIYIPGLALTVALTEISARHLISGSSRLVDAAMNMLKLIFGAVSGVAVADFVLNGHGTGAIFMPPLPAWKTWIALGGLSLGLGIAMNIPLRKLPWGLLSGSIAFGAASIAGDWFGMYAGMFLGALSVGLFSNLFARVTRGPGSILMTQGIVLLVPGSKTYMILNQWISGENILPGADGASQALVVFIALLAGLLFSNAILPPLKSL